MSPRAVLLALGAVLLAAGLFLGLRTVSVGDIGCGSVLSPSDSEAALADSGEAIVGTLEGATPDEDPDNNQAACSDAVGDAKPLAYGALGLGALSIIVSFVASPSRPEGKASIWR